MNKKFLMIAVGVVVLYILYKKFYSDQNGNVLGGEATANAGGGYPCWCQGEYLGMMSSARCSRKCTRVIKNKIRNL